MHNTTPRFTGKLFNLSNQAYFFNTLSGKINPVNKDTEEVIKTFKNHHGGCDVPRSNPESEDMKPMIENPYSFEEVKDAIEKKLRLLALELTSICNMACTYCIDGESYNEKNCLESANMKAETAFKAVDYLFDNSENQKFPLAISFYGGEPLLRFTTLKKVVKYAQKKSKLLGRGIVFSMTTNGTLVTPEIAHYLISNSIQTVISMDGPESTHDRYRLMKSGGETHHKVFRTLELLKNLDPEYFDKLVRCSIVVTPKSNLMDLQNYFDGIGVNILANNVDSYGLERKKFKSNLNDNGMNLLQEKIIDELKEKGFDYLEREDVRKNFGAVYLSSMLKRFTKSQASKPKSGLGQCILGTSRLFLSASGDYYPCEKVAGHSYAKIGNVDSGIDVGRVMEIIHEFYEMAKKKCSGCWMSSKCSACIALACSGDKLDMKKYNHYCGGSKEWGETSLKIVAQANRKKELV